MNEHLQNIATDFSEVALDSLIKNDLLREIPILGTLINLAKVSASIPDRIFAMKVKRFATTIDDIPKYQKIQFHALLNAKPDLRRKAGEVIVFALDRADDLKKAAIIGKLFSLFVVNKFDFDTLRRLLMAVDRAFIDDLLNFPNWAMNRGSVLEFDPKALDGSGLIDTVYPVVNLGSGQNNLNPKFGYSELGGIYARLLLGYQPAP